MNLSGKIYAGIVAGVALWCAAIVLSPVLIAASGPYALPGEMLYAFFHRICHQMDDRSFHLLGKPLAVCIRCTSIYVAFLLGTLAYPLFRKLKSPSLPSRAWLLIAIVPMVVDVCAGAIGFHAVDTISRVITGSLLGFVLPF
jgi:uncharacterized membrane protein